MIAVSEVTKSTKSFDEIAKVLGCSRPNGVREFSGQHVRYFDLDRTTVYALYAHAHSRLRNPLWIYP